MWSNVTYCHFLLLLFLLKKGHVLKMLLHFSSLKAVLFCDVYISPQQRLFSTSNTVNTYCKSISQQFYKRVFVFGISFICFLKLYVKSKQWCNWAVGSQRFYLMHSSNNRGSVLLWMCHLLLFVFDYAIIANNFRECGTRMMLAKGWTIYQI